MDKPPPNDEDRWVWVLVQTEGQEEQFLGQHDTERDISFIPAFYEREDAEKSTQFLQRDERTCEVQAIRISELSRHAAREGFTIFILGKSGEVVQKIQPGESETT